MAEQTRRHFGVQAGLAPPAGRNGLDTSFPGMGQGRLGFHGKLHFLAKTGKIPLLLSPPHTCLNQSPVLGNWTPELSSDEELLVCFESGLQ